MRVWMLFLRRLSEWASIHFFGSLSIPLALGDVSQQNLAIADGTSLLLT